jgi:hypothetical protein
MVKDMALHRLITRTRNKHIRAVINSTHIPGYSPDTRATEDLHCYELPLVYNEITDSSPESRLCDEALLWRDA